MSATNGTKEPLDMAAMERVYTEMHRGDASPEFIFIAADSPEEAARLAQDLMEVVEHGN